MTITHSTNPHLQKLADLLSQHFGVPNEWRALSGGVLSGGCRLPYDRYEEAKAWLTEQFGEPEVKEPWYPQHTKGVPPLQFRTGYWGPDNGPADHVNLVSMMQRADKRYVLLSFC